MKTYIKPETIVADMIQETSILIGSIKNGTSLKDSNPGGGTDNIYTKENNGWDDFEE